MRIAFDLDGVIYSWLDSVRYYLTHCLKLKGIYKDPNSLEFCEQWGFSEKEWYEIQNKGVDAGIIYLHGEPIEGSLNCLHQIKHSGHSIHIITNRYFGTKSQYNTVKWLKLYGVPYDSITFSADKTILKSDYIIEDNIDNHKACLEAGINSYLIDRPWNQNTQIPNRIFNYNQFLYAIYSFKH